MSVIMLHRLAPVLSKWQNSLLPRSVSLASKAPINETKESIDLTVSDKATPDSAPMKATSKNEERQTGKRKTNTSMISEVFNDLMDKPKPPRNLKSTKSKFIPPETPSFAIDKKIEEAKDLTSLLDIAATPNLSRKSALSILSIIGDWTSEKKVKLTEFETDVRFLKMCRTLSQDNNGLGDLATVLGVTGDDQVAKVISTASLTQMVQIMEKLAIKKKRSPPVLRSLSFSMSQSEEKLNIKQCADVLYAMASLSFHDEVLLLKICGDAVSCLSDDARSAVVGSIARSIGIMRCRDIALLDGMSAWLEKNCEKARPQDVVAVLMALASVDYIPNNAETMLKNVGPLLRPLDLPSAGLYLDAIWSLLILDRYTAQQVAMVLSADFFEKLRKEDGDKLSMSTSLKLLNVNAAAQYLINNYQGPKLSGSNLSEVPFKRSKDKTALVNCVMETLLNLLPGEDFLRRDVDSKAGFIIDGECFLDNNCIPIPVTNPSGKDGFRVAVMVSGYFDTCVGARFHSNGINSFSRRLLDAKGYRVLSVLHSEFSPSSKLVQRVKYLEHKLKSLANR